MSNLPDRWEWTHSSAMEQINGDTIKWVRLDEIADVVGGLTKDIKKQSDPNFVEVPYLRVANVQRGYLDLQKLSTIRVSEKTLDKLRLEPGDILFNEGGDRDKLGRGWIWEGQVADCIHQNHVFRARLRSQDYDPKFISMHGNTFGRTWFEKMGKQTTNLASLSLKTIKSFPVPKISLDQQRSIVAAIEEQVSRLNAGLVSLEHARSNIGRMRASVYNSAVNGLLNQADHASGREVAPSCPQNASLYSTLTGGNLRKVDRAIDEFTSKRWTIPPTWKWRSAAEVCETITSGSTPEKSAMSGNSGDIPYIKVYNLTKLGNLDFSIRPTFIDHATHQGPLRRSRLLPGDVLINIVGPPLGKAAVVPDTYPEWNMNQAVVTFRSLSSILDPRLLKYWMLSPPIIRLLESTAKATTGQFNVSLTTCRALPLPIPPREDQAGIVASIEEKLSVIETQDAALTKSTAQAKILQSAIFSAAFSGISASQD